MHEQVTETETAIPQQNILAHLERILASKSFKDSPRLKDILSFIVRETLNGRGSRIKEYTISIDVYRTGTSHDSSRQSIIRTAVGRLRARLKSYYETEALDETVRIEIPRGEYIPVFAKQCTSKRADPDSESCAVLPFRDFRGDDPASQLADSITDELIHRLTYVRGLKVISRTSSFAFRDASIDVAEIASRLGVRRIVEGSLRRVAKETQLAVGVIDARDVLHIWSGTFSAPHRNILDLQHRMANAVVRALRPAAAPAQIRPGKSNLAAWSLYRQGRFHAEKRTAEGWAKSIECFQKALKKDRDYALAHAGIADAHILLANFGEMRSSAAMSIARKSAEAALAIDPELAEAHTSMAAVKMFTDWDWTGAEQEIQLALQLSPSYSQAHHWYSRFLSHHLRAVEAKAEMELALSLDPVSPGTHASAGMVAFEARRLEDALKHFQDALDLAESHPFALWQMGLTEIELGRPSVGLKLMQRARKSIPASCRLWSCIGYAHAKAGNVEQALQWLKRLQQTTRTRYVSPLDIALIYAGLGQLDQVFALIEEAIGERDNFLCWLSSAPYWASLHGDARFRATAKLIGLPLPEVSFQNS
jgi:TolB-like protein/Tfp pilus assembly protein PilF